MKGIKDLSDGMFVFISKKKESHGRLGFRDWERVQLRKPSENYIHKTQRSSKNNTLWDNSRLKVINTSERYTHKIIFTIRPFR